MLNLKHCIYPNKANSTQLRSYLAGISSISEQKFICPKTGFEKTCLSLTQSFHTARNIWKLNKLLVFALAIRKKDWTGESTIIIDRLDLFSNRRKKLFLNKTNNSNKKTELTLTKCIENWINDRNHKFLIPNCFRNNTTNLIKRGWQFFSGLIGPVVLNLRKYAKT